MCKPKIEPEIFLDDHFDEEEEDDEIFQVNIRSHRVRNCLIEYLVEWIQ